MPPTLLAIVALNFLVAQLAPGGPVEHMIGLLSGDVQDAAERVLGGTAVEPALEPALRYRGSDGMDPRLVAEIERQFGFDKPPLERFWLLLQRLSTFDLGRSLFLDRPVAALLLERAPVTLSLGAWSLVFTYLIAVPLGIALAVRRGTGFDRAATALPVAAHAVPAMVIAVALLLLFAGGRFWQWFSAGGLVSPHWWDLSWPMRIVDWLWHLALPVAAMVIAGFSTLALLTRNLFLEELGKTYVLLAAVLSLFTWTQIAGLTRAEFLRLRGQDFVRAQQHNARENLSAARIPGRRRQRAALRHRHGRAGSLRRRLRRAGRRGAVARERPTAPLAEPAPLDADPGNAALEALRASGGAVEISLGTGPARQSWRGRIEDVKPAMGFANIIRPDFHLHLKTGAVAGFRAGPHGLEALDDAGAPTGLVLRPLDDAARGAIAGLG